jgi:His/Glu/Gln/Arg/opine family amino acid ABC transporter permease subunit
MNELANLASGSHWGEVLRALPVMLIGLKYTVVISVLSMAIALVLGWLVTAMRVSRSPLARAVAFAYVQLFRAFSTYVYILFIYFGLAAFFRVDIPPVHAAIIALSLLNSADIMFVASKAASVNYLQFEYYTVVAAVFVLIVFLISRLGDLVERKLAPP